MFDFYREALLNTLFKGKIFLQSFCNASIPPYIFLLQKGFFYGAKGFGEICIVSFHVCSITTGCWKLLANLIYKILSSNLR